MLPPVSLLIEAAPAWFELSHKELGLVRGLAHHGPWERDGLDLTIKSGAPPTVRETEPGVKLPVFCPDRHIQGDRTFCVGLNRAAVETNRHASAWWQDLDQYLTCQAIAGQTGVWPPHHALDHGFAGDYHQAAINLARRLNLQTEYEAAHLGEPSWLTSTGLELLGLCRPPGEPKLAKPRVGGGFKRQAMLRTLVALEQRRRQALARYWTEVEAGSQRCCGRGMRDCRFPKP
jgi:hypothetical protein